ncbi:MAG: phosphonate metabolism protein [Rhodobacteraceae bacterium PARR1]|nr:MAG: phosphonate metabolism protein [Rhodobacteraceae bacterium PARR1]
MTEFRRYAIYYAPRPGDFADACASWLGWDVDRAAPVPHPVLAALAWPVADLTRAPRKYGFHGTIRAPFRLADGVTAGDVTRAVEDIARALPPVSLDGLALHRIKGFLALTPTGDESELLRLGAEVVSRSDHLRAPLTEAEIAKRQPARLSPRQKQLLDIWGYPYVMEEFQFHLTLSDDLPEAVADSVAPVLTDWLAPVLPRPFEVQELCLMGEDDVGRFHLLSRHALTGG